MRVINRIHNDAAHRRANPHPALNTCFAILTQTVLFVSNFANRSPAFNMDFSDLSRSHPDLGIDPFTSQQRCRSSSRSGNLRTGTWFQFYTVNCGTHRDIANWQRIADTNWRFRSAQQLRTWLYSTRRNDIAALTIRITHQSNMSRTIRIIFDTFNFCGDSIFIATKIHDSIMMTMSAAPVTRRDMTIIIATRFLGLCF